MLAAWLRAGRLDVPLERDEGEYAYAGQLILQGALPYQDLYNMKMPGIYAAYALILSLFGQTARGVHFGLLLVNLATILFVYFLAVKLFDRLAGLVSAGAFTVLSLSPTLLGMSAKAEHFVLLFSVIGLWLAISSSDMPKGRILLSGLMMGCAFLMKQHALFHILFGAIVMVLPIQKQRAGKKVERLALYCLGVLTPFLITLVIYFFSGGMKDFLFWTFQYASAYASQNSLQTGLPLLELQATNLLHSALPLWGLSLFGFLVLLFRPLEGWKRSFVFLYFLCSFFSIFPGLVFRPHYFLLILPASALLIGVAGSTLLLAKKGKVVSVCLGLTLVASLLYPIVKERQILVQMDNNTFAREIYGANPFPESIPIARLIESHTYADDRIAIIGSEPQIYFYSKRRAATGFIYMYALMETHPYARSMQQRMIEEIEHHRPRIMVFVEIPTSWLKRAGSWNDLMIWYKDYRDQYYDLIARVEILSYSETLFLLDEFALQKPSQSPYYLQIYQRKTRIKP